MSIFGSSMFIFFYNICLLVAVLLVFIAACRGSSLACRLSLVQHRGASLVTEPQALGAQASSSVVCGLSSCSSWALGCRLSSHSAQALLPCSLWDLSSSTAYQPTSPALEAGLLSTGPPGKSCYIFK